MKKYLKAYIYDHPTPYKNSYYVLQFNFSGIETGTEVGIQDMTYGEYPAGQGFVDMYIVKVANSLATYEAVVELKYLNREKARKFNFKKSVKEAREQMERYLEDKRMKDKDNLKKFVIVFEGFDKYYIEEL